MEYLFRCAFIAMVGVVCVAAAYAQEPVGIFDDHVDVGDVLDPGFASYDANSGLYSLEASGETIGDEVLTDEFHFAYKEISGSFAIECRPAVYEGGRAGLMIRQDLTPGSPHASFLMQSDGLVFPTFRTVRDGATVSDGEPEDLFEGYDGTIRLERVGNSVHYYTLGQDGGWDYLQTEIVQLRDPILVGFAGSAENANQYRYFDIDLVVIQELPVHVTRSIPTDTLEPGSSLNITVTASTRPGETVDGEITEVVPTAASNTQVSEGELVTNEDGSLTWTLTGFSGQATLTYTLTVPNTDTAVWRGTFTDGENEGYIGGDLILPKNVSFTPRGPFTLHPIIPTFIDAEWATVQGNPELFGLHIDPRTPSGVVVQGVVHEPADPNEGTLAYPLQVQESGTYYFFASARREDSQSDSLYIGFDEVDGTDDFAFPIGGDKDYNRRWFQHYDPTGRFWNRTGEIRGFDLTAGEHTLLISPREDSAKIDWMVVTADPNMDITSYREGEVLFVVTRDLPELQNTIPASVSVALNLYAIPGKDQDILVRETPPPGWAVSNLKATGGTVGQEGNEIVWSIPDPVFDATLTYDLAPAQDDAVGVFAGEATDQLSGYVSKIIGDDAVPSLIDFSVRIAPIDVGPDIVFLQAELPHAFSGEMQVKPDTSLVSKLYVESLSDGRTGGVLNDNEISFQLNLLQSGTYYIFANCRAENSNTDSYYVGFDFVEAEDPYGYSIPNNAVFQRRWIETYVEGERFWVRNYGEARPYELTAGLHTLHWHAREPQSKVDWIAITMDPALDINSALEPGEETAVSDFMLY